MNKYLGIGRFTKDPQIRKTSTGKSMCFFQLAIPSYKKGEALFIPFVAWEKTAEIICNNCAKGSQLGVEGHATSRHDKDKHTITEIVVDKITFCGPKVERGTSDDVEGTEVDTEVDLHFAKDSDLPNFT